MGKKYIIFFLLVYTAAKSVDSVHYAPININKITAWYASDGRQETFHPLTKQYGVSFPRRTTNSVYTAGILFGGKLFQNNQTTLFANGSWYDNTMEQGGIIGIGTGVAEDKTSDNVRMWRIRRDYSRADLRRDAADVFNLQDNAVSFRDIERLRAQYRKDWMEWPASKGAPFYDSDNNGIYEPKFTIDANGKEHPLFFPDADEPGIANADQILWYVCNDVNRNSPWASRGVGLEMQLTVWAYNQMPPLSNIIFKNARFIYKGVANTQMNSELRDMYVSVFSDIDIGTIFDDLAGCDSALGLGYIYNSTVLDKEYQRYSIIPPAIGYDLLQGPAVQSIASDSGIFKLQYRKGIKNLPANSFAYSSGNAIGPSWGASGLNQVYQLLRGYPARPDNAPLKTDPVLKTPTKFWVNGDPISMKGWIDGVYDPAGNRDMYLSAGPFTMALSDTQEIVVAMIVGEGADRSGSLSALFYFDRFAQELHDNLYNVMQPIQSPLVTATALENGVILEWERDTASYGTIERYSVSNHRFEGYTVYQLPSLNSPRSQWKRIKTFDVKNEVTHIVQPKYNIITQKIEEEIVQKGSNSGIERYIYITGDSLRNNNLINGQKYYFAVTSYTYNSNINAAVRSYESSPFIVEVVPQMPKPGTVLPYKLNQILNTQSVNIIGNNDARIGVKVLNPYLVKGGLYEILFGKPGVQTNYTIVKNLTGTDYFEQTAKITSSAITPALIPDPHSTGNGRFVLNDAKTQIKYDIEILNITGSPISASVKLGTKQSVGVVVKDLTITNGIISGYWTSSDNSQPLSDSLVKEFIGGNLFIVINTLNYPQGEIRGQIENGLIPRTVLPFATSTTEQSSITSFQEIRISSEAISVFCAPASLGIKLGQQIFPTSGEIINTPNLEGTYTIIGPGSSLSGNRPFESEIEIRFTSAENWAIVSASSPATSKYIRVPFEIFVNSVRVWPVISNAIFSDSVWDTKGNYFQNGRPTFDAIAGIVDTVDAVGNKISYFETIQNGNLPTTNLVKGKLINAVNHIAKNISFVDLKGEGIPPATGTIVRLVPFKSIRHGDVKRIELQPIRTNDIELAKKQKDDIKVFPNPYYGVNSFENSSSNKYVTFSHLPEKAKLRIFNLAGIHVRTLIKDSPSQFFTWDLKNLRGFYVSSGIYIIHISMEELGEKIIKAAIIMEDQQLNTF